ncbi:MAG: tetratricopeptide repeat protein [Flavobacteriales bacterium]|jgi:tetratricopeptide (TPR) repeat protein|nr:tetratricopeptide repeat protein [Flavobacteriales bacterium]
MTRALLLICACAMASQASALTKSEADSLVAFGQRAYAEGRYEVALSAFDSTASAFRSAGLCLALGNSHYKLGDAARAILWYERGLRLAPNDGDLQMNLDLASEQIRDRIAPSGTTGLGKTWSMLRGNDPDAWARYTLFACLLLFTALASARLTQGLKRQVALAVSAMAFMAMVACMTIAWSSHREVRSRGEAIIMVAKVEALSEPRNGAKQLFVLHRGAKVSVAPDAEGWCTVILPNGATGWVPSTALERI